jgi:SSS family transporter
MVTHLESLDYVALSIYIFLMAGIGISFGWLVRDIGSYFKGGSTVPWIMSSISNFMALFSTFVFVAYAGIAYQHGLVAITVFWSTVPACIIGGVFLARRWRRTGHTTPMEYLEQRYNLPVRQTISWFGLLMRFLDNIVRLYAIGVFITVVTPLSLNWSIVISGIIVTFFNIIGGVWSVIVMGIVQFVILIFAVLILLPLSIGEAGGLSALYEKIPDNMTWFNGPKGNLFWLLIYYFMIVVKYNENWTFIQKFYCVRDEKAALKVGVFTGILFLVFTPIFMLPAIASHIILPEIPDPEMSYVAVSKMLLPPGIMGIMFASMFAATMSSLNSEYNIMSGVLTKDVYKRMINPKANENQLLYVARFTTGLVGVLIILGGMFVRHFGGAFEANKLFTGILAIPLGIPLIFGILVKRPNATSSILTIIIGALSGVILNAMSFISWEFATLIETAICLAVYFIPSYFLKEDEAKKAEIKSFFKQMSTPLKEEEKPVIAFEYKKALVFIFLFSLVISGGLFIGMSIPSLKMLSGILSFSAGILCEIGALAIWIYYRYVMRKSK